MCHGVEGKEEEEEKELVCQPLGRSCREMAAWAKARGLRQDRLGSQRGASSQHSAIHSRQSSGGGVCPTQPSGGIHLLPEPLPSAATLRSLGLVLTPSLSQEVSDTQGVECGAVWVSSSLSCLLGEDEQYVVARWGEEIIESQHGLGWKGP